MRRFRAAAMLMAGMMAAVSCSGPSSQDAAVNRSPADGTSAPPPAVTASPTTANLNNASLPLDRYTTSVDDYIELDYAAKLMTFDCMERFGYKLNPGGRLKLNAMRDRTNRLGLVDEAQAARAGYHLDPVRAGAYSPRDNGPKLTDEQGVVMFGDPSRKDLPERGCTGEGYRKIGWNVNDDMWLQDLEGGAAARTFSDKRALVVLADWSACMKGSGYRYDKPEDASQDRRWWKGDDDAAASNAEKSTAVADVRCKKKVNYVGRMTAILTAYQQQSVEGNLERLESVHRQVQEALKNAAAVLGGR